MNSTVHPFPRPFRVSNLQGALALDLSSTLPEPPQITGSPLDVVADEITGEIVTIAPEVRDDLETWAKRFAQVAMEVVHGNRPVSQLVRWTSSEVYANLRRRAELIARASNRPEHRGVSRAGAVRTQVTKVHICFITPRIAEVSVHAVHGRRARALAVRFERRDGRWWCNAMDFS